MFKVIELINEGVRYFYAGGNLGFDMMAALTVLNLKKRFPHIKLILALPYEDRTKCWREENQKIRSHILKQADMVAYLSEKCVKVDIPDSTACVCYLTDAKDIVVTTS